MYTSETAILCLGQVEIPAYSSPVVLPGLLEQKPYSPGHIQGHFQAMLVGSLVSSKGVQ